MKLFVLILGFLTLLVSCRVTLLKDDELTLEREDYEGSELKLDGYYYEDIVIGSGEKGKEVYFLYRNGILLYGTVLIGEDDVLLEMYRSGEYARDAQQSITNWGVFQIDTNIIKFDRWYPSSGGGAPTAIKEGKILNDTTFHITEEYKIKKGKKVDVVEVNSIYHFKAFSPKPDSTNTFVK